MKWNLFTLVQINTLEWIMYKPLLSFLFLNYIYITYTVETRRHLEIHSLLLQCRFRGSNVGQMSNLTGPVFETFSHTVPEAVLNSLLILGWPQI